MKATYFLNNDEKDRLNTEREFSHSEEISKLQPLLYS